MKALIIDNQMDSQKALKHLLKTYFDDIEIVGIESDILNAIKVFNAHRPQLVFLEIDLDDGNGFDFISQIDHSNSVIIIISHNYSCGIRAIKASVSDYFIKPFSKEEFHQAMIKAKKLLEVKNILHEINISKETSIAKINDLKFICEDSNGIRVINASQLSHISVIKPYCRLFLTDGSTLFLKISMTAILDQLPNFIFRIHRSHAINMMEVQEWTNGRGGLVIMNNKQSLPIAYRFKAEFNQHMKQNIKPLQS